ncbi:alpha-(1,3)-fucosyltransferase C [Caerostris darwini]|uniref:Fucosyltransferase n=1 Tax=Caerostris darwini TaxID=1538125 RepID=A0AAV4Q1T9_9ARAC|nr:alpha-(1,3)-fucosyltransferase C [Caerostris darwini]
MLQKHEDGIKSYLPPQKYHRFFLQSCTAMVLICIVCYTYVRIDGRNNFYIKTWNVKGMFERALRRTSNIFPHVQRERKTVLLWTPYFSQKDWLPSTQELRCPVQDCVATSNRSLLANSSAVIFHLRNIDTGDLPTFLFSNNVTSNASSPLLVLFNKEAPPNTPADVLDKMNGKIHLMATYRKDSEVYTPYGWIEKRTTRFKIPDFKPDKSTVCWLVSHCQTSSNREVYVSILKQYIDVEIYGKCGDKECPYGQPLDCYHWLAKRCKFYLSFENSICRDYVTEKLYYALMSDMVPIVMGGEDYDRYLPPHSFIDVADFSSPESLAHYLLEVGQHEASYLSYFKWKEKYEAAFVPYLWFCSLCDILHRNDTENLKPHNSVISWWFEEGNCTSV